MTSIKRFFSLNVILVAALLLFVVMFYFAARKVMAYEIELGMDKQAVCEIMGIPNCGMKTDKVTK